MTIAKANWILSQRDKLANLEMYFCQYNRDTLRYFLYVFSLMVVSQLVVLNRISGFAAGNASPMLCLLAPAACSIPSDLPALPSLSIPQEWFGLHKTILFFQVYLYLTYFNPFCLGVQYNEYSMFYPKCQ